MSVELLESRNPGRQLTGSLDAKVHLELRRVRNGVSTELNGRASSRSQLHKFIQQITRATDMALIASALRNTQRLALKGQETLTSS